VPVSQILALTPERPLIGQRCGKTAKTHWLVFMKRPASGANDEMRDRSCSGTSQANQPTKPK